MKLKREMLKVVKKWYSDIAVLKQKHKLLVVLRDNAGENKFQVIVASDFAHSQKFIPISRIRLQGMGLSQQKK